MKKFLFLIFIIIFSSSCNTRTICIHRQSKVVYKGNGVGMTPDCKKHMKIKHDYKTYKKK